MASKTPVQELGAEDRASSFMEKYVNRDFVFSLMGCLQAITIFCGLLVVSLIGSALNHAAPNTAAYWHVKGYSFYAFPFMVAFWCLMTSTIIYFCSISSFRTAELLPKTTFYAAYHLLSASFYLIGTLALLAETAEKEYLTMTEHLSGDVKGLVIGGGVIGCITTGLYILISVLAIQKYRKERSL